MAYTWNSNWAELLKPTNAREPPSPNTDKKSTEPEQKEKKTAEELALQQSMDMRCVSDAVRKKDKSFAYNILLHPLGKACLSSLQTQIQLARMCVKSESLDALKIIVRNYNLNLTTIPGILEDACMCCYQGGVLEWLFTFEWSQDELNRALQKVCYTDREGCVKELLKRGAMDAHGHACASAAESRNWSIVKLLLNAKPNPNCKSNFDLSDPVKDNYERVLVLAAQSRVWDVVRELVMNRGVSQAANHHACFMEAIRVNQVGLVLELISLGADVACCDNLAVCLAARLDDTKVLDALVSQGADPRAQKNRPLLLACEAGKLPTTKYLVEKAKVDITENNNVAVYTALRAGHVHVAEYLVSKNANPFEYFVREMIKIGA